MDGCTSRSSGPARPACSWAPLSPAAVTGSPPSTATPARRPTARWPRRGVMQFHHAHAFRGQVVSALQAELPEAYDAWLAAGAEPIVMQRPDGVEARVGMRSRRETFERALRAAAARQPGLELRRGHVDAVLTAGGRARGLRVDGQDLPADLVVDASGRSGRVTRSLRPPAAVGGDIGVAYVDRQYQLHDGAEPGPMVNPLAWQADLDGYQVIIFLHERGIFSVLIVRPVDEPDLVHLRHEEVFEAACRAVPGPRDVDRSGTRPPDHGRPARWRPRQPLPRADRRRRRPGAARSGVRRRHGLHDDADVRPRDHDVAAAGAGVAPADRRARHRRRDGRGELRRLVRRPHAAVGRGPRAHGRRRPAASGRATTSTWTAGCRPS